MASSGRGNYDSCLSWTEVELAWHHYKQAFQEEARFMEAEVHWDNNSGLDVISGRSQHSSAPTTNNMLSTFCPNIFFSLLFMPAAVLLLFKTKSETFYIQMLNIPIDFVLHQAFRQCPDALSSRSNEILSPGREDHAAFHFPHHLHANFSSASLKLLFMLSEMKSQLRK